MEEILIFQQFKMTATQNNRQSLQYLYVPGVPETSIYKFCVDFFYDIHVKRAERVQRKLIICLLPALSVCMSLLMVRCEDEVVDLFDFHFTR
jgi:hypothetical protein